MAQPDVVPDGDERTRPHSLRRALEGPMDAQLKGSGSRRVVLESHENELHAVGDGRELADLDAAVADAPDRGRAGRVLTDLIAVPPYAIPKDIARVWRMAVFQFHGSGPTSAVDVDTTRRPSWEPMLGTGNDPLTMSRRKRLSGWIARDAPAYKERPALAPLPGSIYPGNRRPVPDSLLPMRPEPNSRRRWNPSSSSNALRSACTEDPRSGHGPWQPMCP